MKYVFLFMVLVLPFCALGQPVAVESGYPFEGEDVPNGPYDTLALRKQARGYTVEIWANFPGDALGRALRIIKPNGVVVDKQAGDFYFDLRDSNGDGLEDLILEEYNGNGKTGFNSVYIYTLAEDDLEPLFNSADENYNFFINDWNRDGIIEIYQQDNIWREKYGCDFFGKVIYLWDGDNFSLNTAYLDNQQYYNDIISGNVHALLMSLNWNDFLEDGPECVALDFAMPFLYRGDDVMRVKNAFDLIYRITPDDSHAFASADEFYADVMGTLGQSEIYAKVLESLNQP